MSLFKHRCWYCGHVSRHLDFIVGDRQWQCKNRKTASNASKRTGTVTCRR